MKKHLAAYLAAACFLFSTLFTFVNLALFSDRGLVFDLSLSIGFTDGILGTLADLCWTAAPPMALFATLLGLGGGGGAMTRLSLTVSTVPMALCAILELLILFDAPFHFTPLVTYAMLFFVSCLALASAYVPSRARLIAGLVLLYPLAEIALLILSMALKAKCSYFYFAEQLPMGHGSSFFFFFWNISGFLGAILFAVGLSLRVFAVGKERESSPPPPPQSDSAEPDEDGDDKNGDDEDDEAFSTQETLSLEDFGIER